MHHHTTPLLALILLFAALLPRPASAQAGGGATTCSLFFSGGRASELEPCGCHANQSGGVQFEAALYRPAGPAEAAVRVEAGGWAGGDAFAKSFSAMKTRFLLRALACLEFDAINFGAAEAALSRYYFDQLRAEAPQAWAALVSANVFCRAGNPEAKGPAVSGPAAAAARKLAFADARVVTRTLAGGRRLRVAITGVATTATAARLAGRQEPAASGDFAIAPPAPSLAPVVARLRPQADLLVVLVDGTARECAISGTNFEARHR